MIRPEVTDAVVLLGGERARDEVESPDWDAASKVHDWRNHVPRELKDVWHILGYEAKLVVYAMAEDAAGREEWE